MSTELELSRFLEEIYPLPFSVLSSSSTKPFVTLTYAQSLDGKIAGVGGKQIILSGKESMNLTHKLRELHDGILVGIGTVLSDDPQLNARFPSLQPLSSQPQPVILDSRLRIPKTSKLFENYKKGINPLPIIVCGSNTSVEGYESNECCKVVQCSLDASGHIDLKEVVNRIVPGQSLMVEGGASVIASFLTSGLVDLVIITIAPVYVGEGIGVFHGGVELPELEHITTRNFGRDVVVVCKPVYKKN